MRLGYGVTGLSFSPPHEAEIIVPTELSPAGPNELQRALESPQGSRLDDFCGCKSAVILASDSTRPSPSHLLIPPLKAYLEAIGIKDIKIVFALGTHRRMSQAEVMEALKDCILIPHCQHEKDRCVLLGETFRGTPVEIYEDVASSDLIIATGNIEYHYYAGYSGGAKAVLPGVSSEISVTKNHMMMRDPAARSGRLDSPVRLDIEDAAGVAGLDFILNAVLNSKKEIVRAVAGDFILAHRTGAKVVDHMYRRRVEPADIVITCAGGSPKDINLYQAHKALENAKGAAVPGGTIILIAECMDGLGNDVFMRWIKDASCPQDCIDRFGREYEFGGHKAALLAQASLSYNLILVSSMPPDMAEMSYFHPAKSVDEALAMARDIHGKDAKMVVMPYGGLTLACSR